MRKVFIIDDNEELVEILDHLLRKEYVVKTKLDTDNLVEEILAFGPDVLVIDHSVGDVNSSDIIQQIRTADPSFHAPIILFSANHSVREIALATGAAGFIEKPSDITYIRDYIRQIADGIKLV